MEFCDVSISMQKVEVLGGTFYVLLQHKKLYY
jgi:hypothetical protein